MLVSTSKGERGRERKRGRKDMNMPHLCSPTMKGSYKKTFIYQRM